MTRSIPLSVSYLVLVIFSCGFTFQTGTDGPASQSGDSKAIAFHDVNIIQVDSGKVISKQSVLVKNGMISWIGNSNELILPSDCIRIDASDQYLMPGLIDMHTHLSDDDDLKLLLANGITTIRNMADVPGWVKIFMGFSDPLKLKRKVDQGKLIGPDIYTASYCLDGDPPVSPFNKVIKTKEDAETEIKREYEKGYDFVKIYDMLTPESFDHILTAAEKYKMPVIGHVPFEVGIDRVLRSNVRSIEHLTGYINNNKGDFIVDRAKLNEYAEQNYRSGIYNCPTLVVWDKLPAENNFDELKNYNGFQYLSWHVKWLWKTSLKYVYTIEYSPRENYAAHMREISREMTQILYQYHCKLLVGTDMNFVSVFPGESALREIELLMEAGLPPIEALKAATINAAECLQKQDLIGTVSVGKRANLLLLKGNPLEDIKNIYSPVGVMIRGRWFDRDKLEKMVGEI